MPLGLQAGNNEKLCQVLDLFLASSAVTMEFVVNSGGKVVKALRGSQDEAVRARVRARAKARARARARRRGRPRKRNPRKRKPS